MAFSNAFVRWMSHSHKQIILWARFPRHFLYYYNIPTSIVCICLASCQQKPYSVLFVLTKPIETELIPEINTGLPFPLRACKGKHGVCKRIIYLNCTLLKRSLNCNKFDRIRIIGCQE